MKLLSRILSFFAGLAAVSAAIGAIGAWLVYEHYSQGLPDYYQLAAYDPPVTTRIYAGDGRLLAEYAVENRVFVPISAIPKRVINAFLAAEDKSFYSHSGIDIPGLINAVFVNIKNYGTDQRMVGASTITQQVTKNFLLTNERSIERKIKEAILALRIEKAFSKNRILELYLNQIYLGAGNYGVAAAALNYFNKSLDELSIAEAAYLAALPKAPNNYSITRYPEAAKIRRDWVISRMLEDGHITPQEADEARATALEQRKRSREERFEADYFAEEVRRELVQRFGEDGLYKKGLTVKSTIEPRLQEIADRILHKHLVSYDRTQGWRGPLARTDNLDDWKKQLETLGAIPWLDQWRAAMVLEVSAGEALIGFADGSEGLIQLEDLAWARKRDKEGRLGPQVKSVGDVLEVGNVIAVEAKVSEEDKADQVEELTTDAAIAPQMQAAGRPLFLLRQIPEISGALIAMDPHTGRVLAMSGGWSYKQSEFNRATQAQRQPGSSFKPIVYLAALEAGYTPSTIILDAPISINQGPGLPLWEPENFEKNFLGPATMRQGLQKSRNLMTIRMAQTIGMAKVAEVAERLGVVDRMYQTLAMSLGAQETTALRMVRAYAEIVNGGKKVTPTFIDRVQDAQGWTIYRHDERQCDGCQLSSYDGSAPPQLPDTREQVLDPANAYQMVSMLEGVVQRGTASAVKQVGKPLAGKTGTTNDGRDVWFVGFSPDLVAGVYLGFDQPRSLGPKATGGRLSAPIFRDFMIEALAEKPATPFRVPPGVRLVKVNEKTGERWQPGDEGIAIWEAFKPGTEPTGQQQIIEGYANYGQDAGYGSVIPLGYGNNIYGGYSDGGTTIIDSTGVYQGGQPQQPVFGQQPQYPVQGQAPVLVAPGQAVPGQAVPGQTLPGEQLGQQPGLQPGQQQVPGQPQPYPVQQQAPVLIPPQPSGGGDSGLY
ncbi:penicillin-binding protein 1A [Dongia mobilis]|uniref:Penicillin-binding protein 1A n=1 Tax=Dongia mobilis TaxID=578943 RepID=A0A4R6WW84_9PROT|nr:penicillin-binding protein 1A [Dongia mobilis]TDQ83937.1 penicillin-binding protein 1A [Dongia mobilis]